MEEYQRNIYGAPDDKLRHGKISRTVMPFILIQIAILLVLTFWPDLVLLL